MVVGSLVCGCHFLCKGLEERCGMLGEFSTTLGFQVGMTGRKGPLLS